MKEAESEIVVRTGRELGVRGPHAVLVDYKWMQPSAKPSGNTQSNEESINPSTQCFCSLVETRKFPHQVVRGHIQGCSWQHSLW